MFYQKLVYFFIMGQVLFFNHPVSTAAMAPITPSNKFQKATSLKNSFFANNEITAKRAAIESNATGK
jgi:hypothetical protein